MSLNRKNICMKLAEIALLASMMAIGAWISIPGPVPFTLQTAVIFLAAGLLGPKYGFIAVLLYLSLGAVGLPVFAGFKGGFYVLIGPTGGYLLGFLPMVLIAGSFRRYSQKKPVLAFLGMTAGLAVCYLVGTVQYFLIAIANGNSKAFLSILMTCVIPFIIPDLLKAFLALFIQRRLSKFVSV